MIFGNINTNRKNIPNNKKIILDLCGGSGSWSYFYEKAGYDVRIITLPENDVRTYTPPSTEAIYGILAAPPCESFSKFKQFHNNQKVKFSMTQETGCEIVNACLDIIHNTHPVFWALENPKGELSSFIGQPRFVFNPYEFGDYWTKPTCLWGDFVLPRKLYTKDTCPKMDLYIRPMRKMPSIAMFHKSAINKIPQFKPFQDHIKTDYDLRAITPPGFAKAFFEANP
jgi:hypothetical protein